MQIFCKNEEKRVNLRVEERDGSERKFGCAKNCVFLCEFFGSLFFVIIFFFSTYLDKRETHFDVFIAPGIGLFCGKLE